MSTKQNHGFTLIEMLLSVAVFGGILAIGAPLYSRFLSINNLNTTTTILVQNLRHARNSAISVDGDSPWGVHVASGVITVYKGASYATRDVSFDQVNNVPTEVTFSGDTEVAFKKFDGLPNSDTIFTLTNTNNQTTNININTKGLIDF